MRIVLGNIVKCAVAFVAILSAAPSSAPATPANCANYWMHGSPVTGRTAIIPCREFIPEDPTSIVGRGRYRVFYPYDRDDAGFRPFLVAAAEALQDSVLMFRDFGRVPAIILIMWDGYSGTDSLAEVDNLHNEIDEACPVVVYRDATDGRFVFFERRGPSIVESGSLDDFKQVVAHEIFHCFQGDELGLQSIGNPRRTEDLYGLGVSTWWVEGSAEFFSNVVYPRVNAEFGSVRAYHTGVRIFDQTLGGPDAIGYPTAAFFQHLANELDEARVVDILRGLPTEGEISDQAYALSGVAGMAGMFHRFGENIMGRGITDSGGGRLPVRQRAYPSRTIETAGVYEFEVEHFTVNTWPLIFLEGRHFSVSVEGEDDNLRVSHRNAFDGSSTWVPSFDRDLVTPCQSGDAYDLLVTSVDPDRRARVVKLRISVEDESESPRCSCARRVAPPDACLIGEWVADRDSFLRKVGAKAADDLSGEFVLRIDDSGHFIKHYDGLAWEVVNDNLGRFYWSLYGFVEGCIDSAPRSGLPGFMTLRHVSVSTRHLWEFFPKASYILSPTPGLHEGNGDEPMGLRWHNARGRPQAYRCGDNSLNIRGLKLTRQ